MERLKWQFLAIVLGFSARMTPRRQVMDLNCTRGTKEYLYQVLKTKTGFLLGMERLKWPFLAILGHFFQFLSPYDPDKSERRLVMTLNSSTITKDCLCKVSALKMVSFRYRKG